MSDGAAIRRHTDSVAQTEAVGAQIALGLEAGEVVLVSGDLGVGKTTLIRGALGALGVREPVISPTFTIGRRYRGRVPVSHLDLFRIESLEVEDPGLLDDYLTPDAIAFVEWPAAAEPALGDERRIARRVELRHAGGDRREIVLEGGEGGGGAS